MPTPHQSAQRQWELSRRSPHQFAVEKPASPNPHMRDAAATADAVHAHPCLRARRIRAGLVLLGSDGVIHEKFHHASAAQALIVGCGHRHDRLVAGNSTRPHCAKFQSRNGPVTKRR